MLKDGICKVREGYYTKTIAYEDINYSVASTEDQAAISDSWCSFLNYFDSALPFQLSFVNHRSRAGSRYKVNIPMAQDDFDSIRAEYLDMLKRQIARSNNGIERFKYITFGIPAADSPPPGPGWSGWKLAPKSWGTPTPRPGGLEAPTARLPPEGGVPLRLGGHPQDGHGDKGILLSPDSFDFRQPARSGWASPGGGLLFAKSWPRALRQAPAGNAGAGREMTVTLHVQTVDQTKAIKTVKGKISDIDKMKVEEQRKATQAATARTFCPRPHHLRQGRGGPAGRSSVRNERMFLLTFLVVNMAAPTRERLGKPRCSPCPASPKSTTVSSGGWIGNRSRAICPPCPWGVTAFEIQRGHDHQFHGDFHSIYDKAADGWPSPLLQDEHAIRQRHHGRPQAAEKSQRAFPRHPWQWKSFAAKREDRQRLSHHAGG